MPSSLSRLRRHPCPRLSEAFLDHPAHHRSDTSLCFLYCILVLPGIFLLICSAWPASPQLESTLPEHEDPVALCTAVSLGPGTNPAHGKSPTILGSEGMPTKIHVTQTKADGAVGLSPAKGGPADTLMDTHTPATAHHNRGWGEPLHPHRRSCLTAGAAQRWHEPASILAALPEAQ